MNRILLVEDDTALATGIEYALTMEGFSVFHAGTLQKAREAARENVFDAVLLDVMLPDGSGYDFCRELRTSPTRESKR